MKKTIVRLALTATLAVILASCSDSDTPTFDEPENPDAPTEDTTVKDLSADEMANCYIVQAPGIYKFKADNKFNQGEGLPVAPEINPASAVLIWQTVRGSVTSVQLETQHDIPYVVFEVTQAEGNALIGVTDEEGDIVWSWHIWMPQDNIESVLSSTGYEVMNMNLGAETSAPGLASSYGMLYQWGRKDPFPAAPTVTGDTQTVGMPLYDIENKPVKVSNSSWTNTSDNTLDYARQHPTVCLSNYAQYSTSRDWLVTGDDALWGNPNGYDPAGGENKFADKGRKTCYDPSPAGWRVAPPDAFSHFTTSGGYAWTFDDFNIADINGDGVVDMGDYNYGWCFRIGDKATLYFPAAARYDGSYAMLMGSVSGIWGSYWSNAPNSTMAGGAFCALSFQVRGQNGEDWITVSPAGAASKADAYSIRCVRDF